MAQRHDHRDAETGRYHEVPTWDGDYDEHPTSGQVIGYEDVKKLQWAGPSAGAKAWHPVLRPSTTRTKAWLSTQLHPLQT